MLPANQVNLGERVKNAARRFPHEVKRTAHVERAIESVFRAFELADADANLAKGGERDPQPVRCSRLLLQLDAALGKSQRLFVAVLHERHVRLVSAYGRQHVARFDDDRQAFGLSQRRQRLVQAALLRTRHAGQRMNHREVPTVACRMESRRRLGDVLANNRHVADVAITEAQFVVREADGARIMRAFGLPQCLGEKRDAAGGLAARNRQAAVDAPQIGQARGVEALSTFGRLTKRLRGLTNVVLQEPRFRQGAADLNLLIAVQARLP